MNTTTATSRPPAAVIEDAVDFATEYGARPFSAWVTVTPNAWRGVDIANRHDGTTVRLTVDDNTLTLRLFEGGAWAGSQTFSGRFCSGAVLGNALAGLL